MNAFVKGGDLPGLKALIGRMKDANRNVLVGLPSSAKAEADGTPSAVVGATHEFGDPDRNIPERSWLRGGIQLGRPKFERLNRVNLRMAVLGMKTIEQGLNELGTMAVGEVKRGFTALTFTPLKPATIAERKRKFGKSSTRPLIASGSMHQEVTYILDGQQSDNARVI